MNFNSLNRRDFLKFTGSAAAVAMFGLRASRTYSAPAAIFDTHVHIAINDPAHYPLGPEFGNVGNAVFDIAPTAENYIMLMDANNIEQAALVQHDPVYGPDNSYIADMAARYPKRFFAVGRLEANADAVEKMKYWITERGLSGFRVNGAMGGGSAAGGKGSAPAGANPGVAPGGAGGGGNYSWIDSAETMKLWETGAQLKAPLAYLIGGSGKAETLAAFMRVMKRVPDLKLILDHMADYNGRQENVQATSVDQALLDAASVAPNLYVKVTTHNLKRFAVNGGSARPAMKALVNAFGAKRIIWGSDVGNSKVSYPEMIVMIKDAIADLSAADQAMILSGSAKSLYRR
jgi:L-fuconolactonase